MLSFFFCFFFHLLYVITKKIINKQEKIKLYTTFEAEIIILEIKFIRGRNDSGANGEVGETTQGQTGKWAK